MFGRVGEIQLGGAQEQDQKGNFFYIEGKKLPHWESEWQ